MSKVFYKHGNAAVGVSDELEKLVNQLLDANPIIKKAIENEIEQRGQFSPVHPNTIAKGL